MAEEIDDDKLHEEGREDKAPKGEGHSDTEPGEDVIPHSAKALSDYHDGLKDLTEAFEHHHGEFLKEMKKHHGAMEHMTLRKHFGNYLDDHEEANKKLVEVHKGLLEDMRKKFAKYHSDLEPLDKDLDEPDEATRDKPTSEPRERRSDRQDVQSHEDKKTGSVTRKDEPQAAPAALASAPTQPTPQTTLAVATKSTPAGNADELSEEDAALFLHVIGQVRKDAKELRRDFEKAVG